eukprot:scaffold173834_cov19-Tisochrysis_lutea.AAC.1
MYNPKGSKCVRIALASTVICEFCNKGVTGPSLAVQQRCQQSSARCAKGGRQAGFGYCLALVANRGCLCGFEIKNKSPRLVIDADLALQQIEVVPHEYIYH